MPHMVKVQNWGPLRHAKTASGSALIDELKDLQFPFVIKAHQITIKKQAHLQIWKSVFGQDKLFSSTNKNRDTNFHPSIAAFKTDLRFRVLLFSAGGIFLPGSFYFVSRKCSKGLVRTINDFESWRKADIWLGICNTKLVKYPLL